jgi:primosomal replication protein N
VLENSVRLEAVLKKKEPLRYTPVGIAIQEALLEHSSRQKEAEGERETAFEIAAIAAGATALTLSKMPENSEVKVEGFLARRWRTGKSLSLHVTRIERINESKTD